MRTHRVSSVLFTTLLGVSAAVDALILPLQSIDHRAYVLNATIDGRNTLLQLGTMTSDVWLACARFGSRRCSLDDSEASISVESKTLWVTAATGSTLSLGTAPTTMSFSNVTLRVMQYHPLDANFTPSTFTSSGHVYSVPDDMFDQPPLVRADIQGVLGLGPNSDLVPGVGKSLASFGNGSVLDEIQNFGVFLMDEDDDGSGSFVQLGGDVEAGFDPKLLMQRGLTTRYRMPLRGVSSKVSGFMESWDLSIIGVQFGGDTALYPRKYYPGTTDVVGDATTAVLSLNDALLLMPYDVKLIFEKTYLSSCEYGYLCDSSILDTLPRISLYLSDKVFFLDPIDYTHVSPTNSSKRIVEIWTTGSESKWVLGAPFLRKFPAIFSKPMRSVDVYCSAGSSCRTQSTPFSRITIDSRTSFDADNATSGSGSRGYATSRPSPTSPPYLMRAESLNVMPWIIWTLIVMMAALSLLSVAGLVRSWMDRRQAVRTDSSAQPVGDTGTVASERDLEEAKQDLQAMLAEEVAEASRDGEEDFVPLQSPREATGRRL